ncbi:MAG: dihydroxy-acid dehydratase, partial [bacterium]|nr:dihydroxy-acid dehydratase [bacterium]
MKERRLELLVPASELAKRPRAHFEPPTRGYARLHHEQVLQADRGCDLDFLRDTPTRGAAPGMSEE